MCQQQFEKEVSYELYKMEEENRRMQRMAEAIAIQSLDAVRKLPTSTINEWLEGRASASALIYPTPVTVGAKNECRFLSGEYARRVRGML